MATKQVSISFDDPDVWENNREKVDSLLEQHTGTKDYPSTKSFPPIIFGPSLTDEAINELKQLQGVNVRSPEDD
ncbi:hypothetical protein BKA59DRAFT_487607 [Fusarium tricinctum]|uniref:Uncharacterized protein n=1 Tax=Fusarium tricinctum TaxID=61284 RepID=A0A8K0RNW9_9HYPO|nr:hypothetical protein BKA59DRAFT_487607 [Fusarium tricinctum]